MTEAVQANLDNVGNKEIATFNLNSEIPADLAIEFEANLIRMIEKVQPHLIVIDIKKGEPSWLSGSLSKIQKGLLSDLIVCPTANASSDTLETVKLIQTTGTKNIAKGMGFNS